MDGVSYEYIRNGCDASGWTMSPNVFYRCTACGYLMSGDPRKDDRCTCGKLSKDTGFGRFGSALGDHAIEVYRPCKMTPLELAYLLESTLGRTWSVEQHTRKYGEFLAHVFFGDHINVPLFDLLLENNREDLIQQYVRLIETMWFQGDDAAQNVVVVTIMERLGDSDVVWNHLATYISDDFREAANRFGRENIVGRTFDV